MPQLFYNFVLIVTNPIGGHLGTGTIRINYTAGPSVVIPWSGTVLFDFHVNTPGGNYGFNKMNTTLSLGGVTIVTSPANFATLQKVSTPGYPNDTSARLRTLAAIGDVVLSMLYVDAGNNTWALGLTNQPPICQGTMQVTGPYNVV